MYKIIFYVKTRGDCPFQLFLDSLSEKVQAKIIKFLDILSGLGPNLQRPYADGLREGIRELRISFAHDQYRALYFFLGEHIIMTNGFMKKTDAVPNDEIERAIRYREDILKRMREGEIKL